MVNNLYTLTLIKAFNILDCFEDDRQEIGIKEIAGMIDMPQSSVYRIIQSLEFVGLIFQNKETKKYRIGIKLAELSGKCSSLPEFVEIVTRHMNHLGELTGETINLAMASCDKIVYLNTVESSHVLRPNFILNSYHPAHSSALGRVLLSELSEAGLRWVYDNNAEDIGLPFPEFLRLLQEVKRKGYAYDDQQSSHGLRTVAAPVYGPGGNILFAMSVSAPAIRMDDDACGHIRQQLLDCAQAASKDLQASV